MVCASFGKRSWKMWWCVVQDLAMYLYKDEQCGVRGSTQQPQPGTLAVRLHHALATRAHDYNKKQHVFRLHTADHAVYLLQTRPGDWCLSCRPRCLPPTDQVTGVSPADQVTGVSPVDQVTGVSPADHAVYLLQTR
ncbi:hypothetical protein HAZT_HAZT000574 [Hyalella azteca]|uniref:Pleckstrin homology domain-containing protein n=1 Tax=Hyalella azteca TaxID=294128 RepID=A0A6A0H9W5_HYAAZ|nr:hypothetical protein HAZT_HAZT000574 [Hyalella azteca]